MARNSYGATSTSYQNSIAEKLEELRAEQKVSYTKLAKLLGVTRQTAANYCTGKTKTIPPEILDRICEIFHVPKAFLLLEGPIRTEDYMVREVCEATHLSEEAVWNLMLSEARFPLNYMLEKAPPEFWRVLNAYFSLAIKRDPSYLEIDPISFEVKKYYGDLDLLENADEEKFRIDNHLLVENALFTMITDMLKRLKGSYWGWKLSQKDEDSRAFTD